MLWDDPVPDAIRQVWYQWRNELRLLSSHHVPRCYFPKSSKIVSMELHGYSDASQLAYAGVVYLRMVDESGDIHISLVLSKTKVAPIKRLTIPRLELCGAQLLAKLLHHCKTVFRLPPDKVFAWTDSTIVLNWLVGNPRRFNTYVGNRVSCIVELIAPDRWNHVESLQNPADCASYHPSSSVIVCGGPDLTGSSVILLFGLCSLISPLTHPLKKGTNSVIMSLPPALAQYFLWLASPLSLV